MSLITALLFFFLYTSHLHLYLSLIKKHKHVAAKPSQEKLHKFKQLVKGLLKKRNRSTSTKRASIRPIKRKLEEIQRRGVEGKKSG